MATALLQSKQHENYVVVHGDLSHISDTLVEMAFRRYGAIVGVERKKKAVTLVFFSNKRSVNNAVNAGKGTTIAGVEVKISPGTTNSMQAAKKKISLVCFAFRSGTCKKGDGCKLTHDPFTTSQPPVQKPKTQKNTIQTCRMNLIGKCRFTEETCKYRHTKIEADPSSSSDEEEGQVPREDAPPAKAPAVSESTKTCAECEKSAATMICETCGDVGLCTSCDGIAHATKIMSRHVRVKIEKPKPKCAECRTGDIRVKCEGCNVELCADCSWKIHAFKIFRGHKRHQIDGPAAKEKTVVEKEKQLPKKVEQKKVVKPVVKSTPKPEAVVPKKTYYADSDDSSSTDGSDERETPSGKSGVEQLVNRMNTMSSESESSESEDEIAPPAPAPPAPAPKKQVATPKKQEVAKPESDSDADTESEDDSVVVPGYAPKVAPTSGFKATAGISSGSVHSVVGKIEAYMNSSTTEELHMSPGLNSYERLLAHDCAERLGLEHLSVGTGLERHIVVSKSKKHSLEQTENGRAEKKRRSD